MSWIEDIQNDLIITTGDGKKYKPSWINAKKGQDYNVAEFEFPNVEGTLVSRKKPLGRKFPIEFYFQGDDHLNQQKAFERSANVEKTWTLEHPLYGILIVHPISLEYDNSDLNVTKITGVLIETIIQDNPITKIQAKDAIGLLKINLDKTMEESIPPTVYNKDFTFVRAANKKNYNLSVPIIKQPTQFEQYVYAFNQANSFVNTATASPLLAVRYTIKLISMPANFAVNTKQRIDLFNAQFVSLRQSVRGLLTPSSKSIYQAMGGSILSSMCLAASTPQEFDYLYANTTLDIMDTITNSYKNFISDLDLIQSTNGGSPSSYIASADCLIALNILIVTTITNLFSIALGAKQERIHYTESDTNIILLTHRFYSLDPNDNNINEMITNNNFGLNEILQIKKGTKVVYYI